MTVSQNNAASQQIDPATEPLKTAWILADGRPGTLAPPRGLAETLGLKSIEWDVTPRRPLLWVPPSLWPKGFLGVPAAIALEIERWLDQAPPTLLLSCGRRAVAAALEIKRRAGVPAVHIQNPRIAASRFDLVVVPAHDQICGPGIEVTLGSMHGVTPQRLATARAAWESRLSSLPKPRIAVSIGGNNTAYRLDFAMGRKIGTQLRHVVDTTGAGLMVTASRRTDPKAWEAITHALQGTSALCWHGSGDNPYFGFLAWADRVIVTGDSVNMVSEAAATGKPVHVIALPIIGRAEKFERFHAAFRDAGITRPFTGILEDWAYIPPNDTERVAARITKILTQSRR